MIDIRNEYYKLRRECPELKEKYSPLFEGMAWTEEKHGEFIRKNDGYELHVYQVENDIEVCIIFPTGESKTFSREIKNAG